MLKIALNTSCGLVPLFCGFSQQLHHDGGNLSGEVLNPIAWRYRLSGDVAMHPFHRIRSRERKTPSQHFVKSDTERVEVAPRIDGTIHPSGLLRRHVRKRPFNKLRWFRSLALARQPRSDAEPS